jgi:transcription initiation factor TFIIIB Brf1 subunit/transcription initiation factor TFIIB
LQDDGDGNLVCTQCGLVAAERIFQEGEDKRFYADDDEDVRQNEVVNQQDALLGLDSTTVGYDRSKQGFALAATQRAMSGIDTTLVGCKRCMNEVIRQSPQLVSARTTALEFCQKYMESPRTVNAGRKKLLPLSIAALLAASRMLRMPIQAKDLCEWSRLEMKSLNQSMNRLRLVLQDHRIDIDAEGRFTEDICLKADLPAKYVAILPKLYDRLRALNPTISRDPAVVAAAVVYEAVRMHKILNRNGSLITLADVAAAANQTTTVILSSWKTDLTPHTAALWASKFNAEEP